MSYERFEKNIIDNIKEAQLKLGFDNRPMSLNYMTETIENLIGQKPDIRILAEFSQFSKERLGKISFCEIKDGVCITIPETGTSYVNKLSGYEFLTELVETVKSHISSLDVIIEIFRKYSTNVVTKKGYDDFDLLVYFSDGKPDEYFYCLTEEPCIGGACHVSYHRFIKEDFEKMFGTV